MMKDSVFLTMIDLLVMHNQVRAAIFNSLGQKRSIVKSLKILKMFSKKVYLQHGFGSCSTQDFLRIINCSDHVIRTHYVTYLITLLNRIARFGAPK